MARSTEPIRILIVDDEPNIRDFLRLGLEYEGFAVAMAGDGPTTFRQVREFAPHVVILDVMLPGQDGWSIYQDLRSNPRLIVIFLTARDDVSDRVKGLELGADDYMVKPFSFQELVARIRLRLRKQGLISDGLLQVGALELDSGTHEVRYRGSSIALSPREFDLLRAFLLSPGQVLSKQQLLNQVWGWDYYGDDNIVEVYVRYLRDKLGDPSLIKTVRGVGYRLEA